MFEYESDIQTNQKSWDERVPVHLGSHSYRGHIATLRAGGNCLERHDGVILEEVGDVAGTSLLHLQCHIGHDTLSWARRGARVTGLDFSPAAIETARRLAGELGIDARFVCANVYDAAEAINERFDVVFASYGVFCWIPDLPRWMRVAASMLKPGGVLYIRDGHPFADLFEDRPDNPQKVAVTNGYFDRGPHRYGPGPSYAGQGTVSESVEWTHTLGDFVNAVIAAGLRIEFLHEDSRSFFRKFEAMEESEQGDLRLPGELAGKLPLVFSLRAARE